MRIILFLCAAVALSVATEAVKEVKAAQEMHLDNPVQMLNRTQEKVAVGGNVPGHVTRVGSCESGWSKYGSRCFIFVHREMSWVDAERYCLRFDANLASIHNLGEYDFIQEVVRGGTGRFPQAWIGGNDAVKDSVWLWSDGSPFYFQDWSFGEPNNYANNEKCIVMNQPDDYRWGDLNCEQRRPFVCGTRPL